MKMSANALKSSVDGHTAVLTLETLASTEPAGYADDAFAAAPYFAILDGKTPPDKKKADAVRTEWAKRGILVCAVKKPQLIFVRVGTDFRGSLTDTELHDILENHVYPLMMRKRLREGTVAAVTVLAAKVQKHPERVQEPGKVGAMTEKARLVLTQLSFPTWRIYYYIALKPLLNTLIITMKCTGFSVWGVVLWLLILHLVTKQDWLKHGCERLNWVFWQKSGLLRWWLLRGQSRSEGKISRVIPATKATKKFTLMIAPSHLPVAEARVIALGKNLSVLSLFEARLLRIGMGLPVWACLTLITLPFWENILTMRNHLLPFVQSGLPTHRVFVLQHGLLWWDKPSQPAGLVFGIIFGLFYAAKEIPSIILDLMIGMMEEEDATRVGVSNLHYWACYAKKDNLELYYKERIYQLIFFPLAVATLPFLLALYFLLATMVEALNQAIPALITGTVYHRVLNGIAPTTSPKPARTRP